MSEMALAQVPLFASLPREEIQYLTKTLVTRFYPTGTVLFREGDVGEHFYVILDGQLEIVKAEGTPEEQTIAVRGPGEFIGELSLLNRSHLRTASVMVRSATRLLEMTRADFDRLLTRNPLMAYTMVQVLGKRLSTSHDDAIRELQEKNYHLAKAYQELQASQAQIIEKEKLEHELRVAYEIQVSILPRQLPEIPGYSFETLMIPARRVGGDFYDFINLEDGLLGIAIGDVADKGVPSAIFMAQTRALLRAEAVRGSSPRRTLEQVNLMMQEMNNAEIFVTVLYGVLDPVEGVFHYARAGHELPLIIASSGEALLAGKSQGMALGVLDAPILDEQSLTIPKHGALLLYTDGVTDARNLEGEFFGIERFKSAAGTAFGMPAQTIRECIYQAVVAHQGEAQQDDDITMVVVQRSE